MRGPSKFAAGPFGACAAVGAHGVIGRTLAPDFGSFVNGHGFRWPVKPVEIVDGLAYPDEKKLIARSAELTP